MGALRTDSRNTEIVLNKQTGKYEIICLESGEVLSDINSVDLSRYKFNYELGLLICQKVREGWTLTKISEDPQFPSLHVMAHWRKINPTFDEEIKLARKHRAEYYHDKVIELAEQVTDDSNIAAAKFKAEQYKWAAEKGDPNSYGNKVEVSGNVAPTSIVVYTGIERRRDIETTAEQIEGANEQIEDSVSGENGVGA
jgi:hypothetical protein